MVKLNGKLLHVFLLAVAITCPLYVLPVVLTGAVKDAILPEPLKPSPIVLLSFTQAKVAPTAFETNGLGEIN